MTTNLPQKTSETPIEKLKKALNAQSVQEQFRNAMAENAPLFVASLIDVYASDTYLQKCSPNLVIMEALKAATLKLPINKNLGFAWIIPRWSTKHNAVIPQFQLGWRGIVQLAQRTAMYKFINCDSLYEGELKSINKLTGEIDISGEPISDKIVGYFAYIELLNGFKKAFYWSAEKTKAHAIRYNQECKKAGKLVGNWRDYFDERSMTTVLKHLISKYGVMSVEMVSAFTADTADERTPEARLEDDVNENANSIPIEPDTNADTANKEEPTGDQKQGPAETDQVPCPNRDGDMVFVSYCNEECTSQVGCPSWSSDDDQSENQSAETGQCGRPGF